VCVCVLSLSKKLEARSLTDQMCSVICAFSVREKAAALFKRVARSGTASGLADLYLNHRGNKVANSANGKSVE